MNITERIRAVMRPGCTHEQLLGDVIAEIERLQADAERLDWLQENCSEELWGPREKWGGEFGVRHLQFKLPPIVSWTEFSGQKTLRVAIDIKMGTYKSEVSDD